MAMGRIHCPSAGSSCVIPVASALPLPCFAPTPRFPCCNSLPGTLAAGTSRSPFCEVRAHLGLETQRQWSTLAIVRTTPCLLGLFSLVVLMTLRLHPDGKVPVRQAAWYEKA